ncbi:hypothetical protein [Paenibacillus sp. GbtcB18]|uniref:hypothetical protein n=1 Tax=Paenibacillus sp. GbtcB18 TaxID=2824763 RepID=UPI001C307D54|nr:hypothetical protein [Paenibacillus sp. GbtcB18]
MDHMEKYWTEDLECIRKGVNKIGGYVTTISSHYLRDRLGNEAYPDRVFDEPDILWAITHRKIVEGYDSDEKKGEILNRREP